MRVFTWLLLSVFAFTLCAENIRIVLPENPRPWEKKAADELQNILAQSLGQGILLEGGGVEFHVGATELAGRQGWRLRDEEWRIRSVGNKLILYGGGNRGTWYATAIFLERFIGVRVFNMHEELIPRHKETVRLSAIDLGGKPEFILRSVYPDSRSKGDSGRYAVFNRMNAFGPVRIAPEYGGDFVYGSPYHVHTFNRYIPEKEFFEGHPEYFALIGGKRNPHHIHGQLCLSNPALENIFWEKLRKYILDDEKKAAEQGMPPPQIYDISQNDNNAVCTCDACGALRKKYGDAEAGLQLDFVNKLARRLKEFRPGLMLSTLAYYQTEKLPAGIALEPNIMIRLCNTANNFTGSIRDKAEAPYRERLAGWGKLAGALSTWDYGVSFNRYARGLPYPSEFFMQENLRVYREYNVRYLFTEREHEHRSDMHSLKGWLFAKLMENPDADFNALMQDFLVNYYGKAAPFIAEYRRTLLESVKKHRPYLTSFQPSPAAFTHLDCATVARCDQLLRQAEGAVGGDPVLLRRVRVARASVDEAIVIFIRKFNLESPEHGLDAAAAARRMLETYEDAVRFCFQERTWNGVLRDMRMRLDIYSRLPLAIPPHNRGGNAIDIPIELASFWAGGNTLAPDSESALGYAAKVAIPAAQLDKQKLPIRAGGYDQQTRGSHYASPIKEQDVKGAGYHWYRLKPVKPRPAGYIYLTNLWHVQFPQSVAAGANPDIFWDIHVSMKFTGAAFPHGNEKDENAIWIDRIIMTPAVSR